MEPILIYGKRRVNHGMAEDFEDEFNDHAAALYYDNPAHVKAVFAFADPYEPNAYWHVFMARDASFATRLLWPLVEDQARFYARDANEPDTMHVYGGWDSRTVGLAKNWGHGVRYRFHRPLSGFIKADGAGLDGPPLFGFTRRRVKPGRVDDLAAAFQPVCDQWHAKVPGCLAATVSRDGTDPD